MKNISLEEKEKIERINYRNNKLRNFLKEIKTENKNLGHKNLNDFSKI
jgi:phosphopantetheine adenylyltransferase